MMKFEDFKQLIQANGLDIPPPPLYWYFLSFNAEQGGEFTGAAFVRSESWSKTLDFAFKGERPLCPPGSKPNHIIQLPGNATPPPEYLNRLLNRAELETVWPWIKNEERRK